MDVTSKDETGSLPKRAHMTDLTGTRITHEDERLMHTNSRTTSLVEAGDAFTCAKERFSWRHVLTLRPAVAPKECVATVRFETQRMIFKI